MRSRLTLRSVLPLLVLSTAAIFANAAQSRISTVNTSTRVALPHTIPARALTGTDLGAAPTNRQLDSMMLVFNRTDAQQAALNQLLIDLQDPSSSRYHQWLTPEQFGAQFGLSAQDLAKVSSWLTSQGFTVTATGRGSNFIAFSGTVAQAQQAFGTSIHSVVVDGETHISNVTDPVLPASIAAVVTGLSGLNDLKLKSRARTRAVTLDAADTTGLRPQFTSSISGNHFVAPGDFYTIYDVAPLLNSGINGAGVTVAVAGQTNIAQTDVTAFRSASGLGTYCFATLSTGQTIAQNSCTGQTLPIFATKLYGTSPGTSSSDIAEAMLDVEWAGAVAPNANIVYVNSTNALNSVVDAINDNLAPIVSISYGDCETNFGISNLTVLNQYFQQANAQGQTIVGPAGDSGATDCDFNSYPAVLGFNVDFPASSPYVTSAGGSMFNEGTGTYWNSNSSSSVNNAGSALSYIPSVVWNESSSSSGLAAAGGGASAFFTKPYWQVDTLNVPSTVPSDSARDVPDIALNSASGHDGSLYCVSGSCVTGFRAADGQSLSVVGGTSVAVPSFAGVLALVEQKTGSAIGNAGPVLYALANSTSGATVFHDIVSGNNSSACIAGSKDCPSGGSIGYTAAAGYDLATGWGSVDVYNLATKWSTVTPIKAGTAIGQNITTTTVTNSSPVCGVSGGSLSLTIQVASAASTTTVPTGTVQLLVDNVASGSAVALAAGSASITFSTAGISSGAHTISAVYSGDVNFASSKGYVNADVVSSSKADFAFTPCTASTTAKTGGTATALPFTIAPVNGFTGSVTFSVIADNPALAASYAFSVKPVTISSSSSTTTSFTLYAYTSSSTTTVAELRPLKPATQETRRPSWYTTGSGAVLASVMLLVVPRRRRWGALLAAVLSVAAFGVLGCGSGSGTLSSTPPSGGTTPSTNSATGTYNIRVTATSGTIVHSTNVTFTVTP